MGKKANGCSLLDAGIDWTTTTFTDGLRARFAATKAGQILEEREKTGFDRTDTNRLGFVGERAEGIFYGWRGDLLMVICSGETAVAHGSFFLGLATNVSRLDLAVTLRDDDLDHDWTETALKQVSMDGRVDSGLLKTNRVTGTPDGCTLYIGSRSSDRFIRIYDKTAESKGVYPERSWRWEIEYKRPRAGIVAARLLRAGATPTAVVEIVKSELAALRVRLPFGDLPDGWVARRPRYHTDDETRLTYTSRVIRPFLSRLIDAVGEARVRDALERSLFKDNDVPTDEGNDAPP